MHLQEPILCLRRQDMPATFGMAKSTANPQSVAHRVVHRATVYVATGCPGDSCGSVRVAHQLEAGLDLDASCERSDAVLQLESLGTQRSSVLGCLCCCLVSCTSASSSWYCLHALKVQHEALASWQAGLKGFNIVTARC